MIVLISKFIPYRQLKSFSSAVLVSFGVYLR